LKLQVDLCTNNDRWLSGVQDRSRRGASKPFVVVVWAMDATRMIEPVKLHMFIRKLHVIATATLWKVSKFSPSRYPDANSARCCISSSGIVHRQRPLGCSLAKSLRRDRSLRQVATSCLAGRSREFVIPLSYSEHVSCDSGLCTNSILCCW
jgi:hypothetical protein